MKTRKTDRIISKVLLASLVGLSVTAFAGVGGDFLSKLMAEGKAMVEGTFQSDGSKVYSTDPLFSITPPKDWSVTHGPGGNSPTLIMQEPEQKFVKGSKDPIFRRNITVSVIQESAPTDDVRLNSFKEELEKKFGNNSLARNFQVIETRFGNWKATNDAIIAYSGWLAGDIQMMQMHILVSGNDRQYMMSYTDMASRFIPESEQMTAAWNTMMSLDLGSVAPSRYTPVVIGGSVAISILGLLLFSRSLRRRRHYHLLSDDSLDCEGSTSEFQSQMSQQFVIAKPRPVNDRLPEFDPVSIPDSNPVSILPVRILRKVREENNENLPSQPLQSSIKGMMQSEMHSELRPGISMSSDQIELPKKIRQANKDSAHQSMHKLSEIAPSEFASASQDSNCEGKLTKNTPSLKGKPSILPNANRKKHEIKYLSEVPKKSTSKTMDSKLELSTNKVSFIEADKSIAKSSPMDSMGMDSWPMSAPN